MIVCLVAIDQNQGIGFENSMPWPKLDSDMLWFKDRTEKQVVLMGSNTWKSLKKPLPNRVNVVISSQLIVDATLTFSDPIEAIKDLSERYRDKDICIIGGQQIYDSVKHLVEKYYITEIEANYTCDRHFDFNFVKENYKEVEDLLYVNSTNTTPAYSIKEYSK